MTVDGLLPSAQAWLDAGFAYAVAELPRFGHVRPGLPRGVLGLPAATARSRTLPRPSPGCATQGLADPASTFITGASFGGHLTLLSVGRLPDLFTGGLAHVAMADWRVAASRRCTPPYAEPWAVPGCPPEMVPRFSSGIDRDSSTA